MTRQADGDLDQLAEVLALLLADFWRLRHPEVTDSSCNLIQSEPNKGELTPAGQILTGGRFASPKGLSHDHHDPRNSTTGV